MKASAQHVVPLLRKVREFEGLPDTQLEWLSQRAEVLRVTAGEYLFKKGEPTHHMYIILQGKLQLKAPQGKQLREVDELVAGRITGVLPYSRMTQAAGYGMAYTDVEILSLHQSHFQEMSQDCPEMVQALVSIMTNRTRSYTRQEQQNERMAALGKLSAGLAHELNNPASAIMRSTDALKKRLQQLPLLLGKTLNMYLDNQKSEAISQLLQEALSRESSMDLSMMQRNELEDELAEWLEEHEIDDPYELAESMVTYGLHATELEEISEIAGEQQLPLLLEWIAFLLSSESLISEISDASGRISSLVNSVKTYSHMDQAPDREMVDIRVGLDSTLTMLGHKIREKKIAVSKDYEPSLPRITAYASELNQVWTNLIDNAIDAMKEGGRMEISARKQDDKLEVSITDNGSGIPPELISKIFDPFFTTKDVGQGTGLGLDIVQKIMEQHRADIKVNSEPGNTRFQIRFPLNSDKS